MLLGENLKKARLKTNLTQEDIAACFGKDRSTYSCWETGKTFPSLENLISLSKIFNMSLDEIILGEKRQEDHSVGHCLAEGNDDPMVYLKKKEQLILIAFRLLDEQAQKEAIERVRDIARQAEKKRD